MKLKSHRAEHDLTQQQLADMVGVSKQTVFNWEWGKTYPTYDHAKRLAKVFNCGLDDIDFSRR